MVTGRNRSERANASGEDRIDATAQANWRQNAVPCLAKRPPSP